MRPAAAASGDDPGRLLRGEVNCGEPAISSCLKTTMKWPISPLSSTGKMLTLTNTCDMSEGLHVHMSTCCVRADFACIRSCRNIFASVRGPKTTLSVLPKIISSLSAYMSLNEGLVCSTFHGLSALTVTFARPSSASAIFFGTQSPWSMVRMTFSVASPLTLISGSNSIVTTRSSPLLVYRMNACSLLVPPWASLILACRSATFVIGPCAMFRLRPSISRSRNPSTSEMAGLQCTMLYGALGRTMMRGTCPTYALYPNRAPVLFAAAAPSAPPSPGFSAKYRSLTAPSTNARNVAGSSSNEFSSSSSSKQE
mmetsp:Transcript_10523/g.26031  ORF Transcript_10523/g.26031 Transcript_10523/m.26031 type:complete len:311 (-) Transcript_10523:45-977(-)